MQWWTFGDEGPVSVGRSLSNHVVVRNTHVSRRHFELHPIHRPGEPLQWQLISHGKNGTFLNGKSVTQVILPDDATLQLAPKGPVMKVYLQDRLPEAVRRQAQGQDLDQPPDLSQSIEQLVVAVPGQGSENLPTDLSPNAPAQPAGIPAPHGLAVGEPVAYPRPQGKAPCRHLGNQPGNLLCMHCGEPLRVIRSLRQYQLLRLLAQGGMGTTFLAWQAPRASDQRGELAPSQRLVVVKQLNPEMASLAKARELFEREAKVLQRMRHPGIPRFLDAFSEGDRSYLVMELVHGQNLEQYVMQTGPASPVEALGWMQQTCDVLHHLHTQHPPILHRDIKPANLLRQYRNGTIVVVDFGAVTSLAGAMGTRIGAEGYTAPEQEAGKPCIASDLFSVGATLLFLLSRKGPFAFYSGPMGTGELCLDELETVGPKLSRLLRRLLSEKISDRPSSALELKLALTACLDDY